MTPEQISQPKNDDGRSPFGAANRGDQISCRRPNFLYIGPDKAGSTWLFRAMSWHPQIYMAPAKDLYFFDRYFQNGIDWYFKHFRAATDELVVGEISHDYLYSVEAASRIAEVLPDVRLMVCLREPVDRAFSAYLYLVKHGMFTGSFEDALVTWEHTLVQHSLYAKHLAAYVDRFPRSAIYVSMFDSLRSDSNQFVQELFTFLGVVPMELPEELRERTLSAARSRSVVLATLLKKAAFVARHIGLANLVGRLKMSKGLQRMLYGEYSDEERPRPHADTVKRLRERFADDVHRCDEMLGTNCAATWGYN
jgi:hypothetical protein